MVLTLSLAAFFCVLVLMCHVRCQNKKSQICARSGVFIVGGLVTLAMYSAGLGVLRTVLVFAATVFVVSMLLSLVQPLDIDS